MKITLAIDGKASIELAADQVDDLVYRMDDIEENSAFFDLFAFHPASAVRKAVANKDLLSDDTVAMLSKDSAFEVRRNLLTSRRGREFIGEEALLNIIATDVDAAEMIAGNIESYQQISTEKLGKLLEAHTDPRVRKALAGNGNAPKRLIKALVRDEDRGVRTAAANTLRYL
jgi:hypothetical protein